MKKCPNCRREIDDNSSFCEFCGCQIKHSKKPLWIALGAVAVAALLFVLLKPKNEPERVDPDTQAYQACQTVDDYRVYICDYGRNALHYTEAKAFVDQYVADSLQRLLDSLAQERAREQAEAEMRQEDEVYQKCTSANGHEYVDLGLPSGTLWATCNVGATKPEGYGNYYAWGETSTKSTYDWDNYRWYANGSYMTKYCNKSGYGYNGFTDNLTALQSGDDPATASWGSGWQTPSKAQWDELLANTKNQWTTRSGKSGRLFTSKKNGQTLFLPAAGIRWGNEWYFAGKGSYWSSSLYINSSASAWDLGFDSSDCNVSSSNRFLGFAVRPVRSARQN